MAPHPIVLIDSCSYSFYRVTATMSWANRQIPPPDDLEQKIVSQFWSHLEKFCKKVKVPTSKMWMIRDCPRPEIWRMKLLSTYKENRDERPQSSVGAHIKNLNEICKDRFGEIIRIHEAEADDVIAVLVRFFTEVFPTTPIYIVSGDSDLHQLLRFPNVSIYNPKGWTKVECDDHAQKLEQKIRKGDPSDKIPAGKNSEDLLRNRVLIDLDYVPRRIQDRVIKSLPKTLPGTDELIVIPRNFEPRNIQLGLCCINNGLRDRKIFCSRRVTLGTLKKDGGMDQLKQRAYQNCLDLITMIKWNAEHGIRVLRISSDLFPHKSNTKAPEYTLDFARELLVKAGRLARHYKQRLTFHPGQYNVVGSPNEEVFQNTAHELDYHAEILDTMAMGPDSVMVVHGGGVYGNKEATMLRWISNFYRLPERVRRRLVLENCEKSYSVADCLFISGHTRVPVVLDSHHDQCYRLLHPDHKLQPIEHYLPSVLETWHRRGITIKMHVSEQGNGAIGKHSDFVEEIPQWMLDFDEPLDIMIEAKAKEAAVFHLYDKYPQLDPRKHHFKLSSK